MSKEARQKLTERKRRQAIRHWVRGLRAGDYLENLAHKQNLNAAEEQEGRIRWWVSGGN